MTPTEIEQVERANAEYYDIVERGDYAELAALWLDEESLSCVHPGWPVLSGRGEVLRSYAVIMANTDYIQFILTDVQTSLLGATAIVTCTENILSGGPPPEDGELGPLVGQLVVATNVFRRTTEGWKLWSHHASPVLAELEAEEGDGDGGPGEESPA
ncbi:nuclear transport factor 2 family protein [Streptomyces albidoflavus]|uniref:3-dehydroquinate dehydratase n=3 Tax=Streptomyces TaxID=1883 RepID=D6B7K7_9ACTN|nr:MULTISPECIES: nuclear transport factor 2 family protein [Streptomyces]MYQ70021.1 DUF4440 domain-containing protein [Streptomyces sp. SID4934]MYW57108.1 DUF4440 domain-containing protein [Streptomyces sp. SID8370]MYW88390.1 DUF4440 domain-containing protein [Streptomyces sp. SID8371]MYX49157.1 DUF4440 domain-containing protein [Streptomyces sp. SID8385]MYX87298.1 DUF4440 domain-containing protein [Streptomyces sp. SID4915]QLA58209.1 nuclear transport factor 2 family protein [Streptomyces vi